VNVLQQTKDIFCCWYYTGNKFLNVSIQEADSQTSLPAGRLADCGDLLTSDFRSDSYRNLTSVCGLWIQEFTRTCPRQAGTQGRNGCLGLQIKKLAD